MKALKIVFIWVLSSPIFIFSSEPVQNKFQPSTYSSFQHWAEIKDGMFRLYAYSADEGDFLPYYPPMTIIMGDKYHTLQSEKHKGIILQSDQLLYVFLDRTDRLLYRGCASGSSSDCILGVVEIVRDRKLKQGEKEILSLERFKNGLDVHDIYFSSGVLDMENSETYYYYARPHQIRLTNNRTGEIINTELQDTAHFQAISINDEWLTDITLEVLSLYPGRHSADIAMNSILVHGEF